MQQQQLLTVNAAGCTYQRPIYVCSGKSSHSFATCVTRQHCRCLTDHIHPMPTPLCVLGLSVSNSSQLCSWMLIMPLPLNTIHTIAGCPCSSLQAAWPEHKSVHKQAAAAAAWLYCTKRGKGRSAAMPMFDWTGSLRPAPIGPPRQARMAGWGYEGGGGYSDVAYGLR